MTIKAQHPVVASDFRFRGEGSRVVASNGEINANDKRDLLQRQLMLMKATASGEVITASDMQAREAEHARNKELIAAAFSDKNAQRVLGEKMAQSLYMTGNRKGYARRLLARIELKQGEIPRFPVRKKNVTAMTVTGPAKIATQLVSDKWLMPPELSIAVRLFVPQNEINQSNSDVLEEKYTEGLEGTMVAEDRMWYNLAKATVGVDNNLSVISGTLSPLTFMQVRQNVQQWGMKPQYAVMASDLYVDVVGDSSFIQAIDPVAKHELVMTGELGVLYGMTLISEDYRHPEHKVFAQGEFAIVSDPVFHGAYSDRGGINSQPIDSAVEGVIGRGWLLHESMAMAIANTRSVAFARRI